MRECLFSRLIAVSFFFSFFAKERFLLSFPFSMAPGEAALSFTFSFSSAAVGGMPSRKSNCALLLQYGGVISPEKVFGHLWERGVVTHDHLAALQPLPPKKFDVVLKSPELPGMEEQSPAGASEAAAPMIGSDELVRGEAAEGSPRGGGNSQEEPRDIQAEARRFVDTVPLPGGGGPAIACPAKG